MVLNLIILPFLMAQTETKPEIYLCPKGHPIYSIPENYAGDDSDNSIDSSGELQFESGLFCLGCKRPYGLSKLVLSKS
jgi:hypothetical protein